MAEMRLGAAVLGILAVILLASVGQLYRFTLWLSCGRAQGERPAEVCSGSVA